MKYNNMAKFVHNATKDPQSLLSEGRSLSAKEISYNEYAIIKSTLLKSRTTENTMSNGLPPGLWA